MPTLRFPRLGCSISGCRLGSSWNPPMLMKPRWVSPRTGCSTLMTSAPQSARMAPALPLGSTAAADTQDMDGAIAAARHAFDDTDWSTNRVLRKRCLEQLQSAIEAEHDDLREELIAEVGCPAMTTQSAQLDWPLA